MLTPSTTRHATSKHADYLNEMRKYFETNSRTKDVVGHSLRLVHFTFWFRSFSEKCLHYAKNRGRSIFRFCDATPFPRYVPGNNALRWHFGRESSFATCIFWSSWIHELRLDFVGPLKVSNTVRHDTCGLLSFHQRVVSSTSWVVSQ